MSWISRTQECATLSTRGGRSYVWPTMEREPLRERSVSVMMPSLGSPSIGVFKDKDNGDRLLQNSIEVVQKKAP